MNSIRPGFSTTVSASSNSSSMKLFLWLSTILLSSIHPPLLSFLLVFYARSMFLPDGVHASMFFSSSAL